MNSRRLGRRDVSLSGIRAIAFDIFGTLCQADPVSDLLRWHAHLPSGERRRLRDDWMCGRIGLADLVEYGDTTAAPPIEVLAYQAQALAATTRLFDAVPTVLNELKRRGYPMACVSNLAPPFGPPVRKLLSPWIEHFVFSYEIGARKPGRALFDAVVESLALPPQRILMVGDSPRSDIEGARQAGMPSVLVSHKGATDALQIGELLRLV